MADDALTRKEAEMERLTELLKRLESTPDVVRLNSFRPEILGDFTVGDLRRALSLESVREEDVVLAQAFKMAETSKDRTDNEGFLARQLLRLQHAPARVAEGANNAVWNEEIEAMHAMADELDEDGMPDTASWLRDTARRLTTYHKASPAPESPAKEQPEVAMPDVKLTREWVEGERRYWLDEAAGTILPHGFLLRAALCASWLNSSKEQPGEQNLGQGWIPVSERLPEDGAFVWVYGKYELQTTARFTHRISKSRFFGYVQEAESWDDDITHLVTHWMPLPPPPERP